MSVTTHALVHSERGAYDIGEVPPTTPGAVVCGICGAAWLEDLTPCGRCPWEYEHADEFESPRYWGMDAEVEDGHPQPYGSDTVGIVDEHEGGVIAYTHADHAARIVAALNR